MPDTKLKLTRENLADLKIVLRQLCPNLRSAHADEALARAVGHRTHASLLSAFDEAQNCLEVDFGQSELLARLVELGYAPVEDDIARLFRLYAEMQHERIWEGIRSLAIRPANDNVAMR